eukprot:CAMPEP_0117472386 /NCGR_PEP_ID=MMETSP0784-20121206/8221_1 /TAXON_ID=39447 /ORGANISM="" /LENGTH=213 /DNA_ID=CAMNT_0005266537 /DNA_START=85 /DNA_END=727 /DNA_ORIENTATION=+
MGGAPEKRVLLAVLVASFVFGGLSESVVKPALQEGPTDAKAMKVSEVKPHDSRTSSARAAALRHRKEALLVELASVQAKIDGRSEDPSTTGTAASGIASIPPDDVGELSNESEADEAANAEEDAIVASEYHDGGGGAAGTIPGVGTGESAMANPGSASRTCHASAATAVPMGVLAGLARTDFECSTSIAMVEAITSATHEHRDLSYSAGAAPL